LTASPFVRFGIADFFLLSRAKFGQLQAKPQPLQLEAQPQLAFEACFLQRRRMSARARKPAVPAIAIVGCLLAVDGRDSPPIS